MNISKDRSVKWQTFQNKYMTPKYVTKWLWSIVRAVIIAGLCYIILFPFFEKIINAFKSYEDLIDPTVKFLHKHFTLENVSRTVQKMQYWQALINTLILSTIVAFLQTFISALVGYGFAKFKFWGNKILFFFVILMLIIPPQTIIVPMFIKFRYLQILDTPFPLVVMSLTMTGFKNGLYIFMFRQFFRGVPKELNEAANIDGCGVFRTFFTIMLPSATSMLTTIFLLSFSWQWTDTVYNGLFLKNMKLLSNVISQVATGELQVLAGNLTHTAALLAVLPLALLFIFAQKAFVESIDRSGIVG